MLMMLWTISSCSGPSLIPNSSPIVSPGNTAAFVRRKNSPDSRSSTVNPNGFVASQPSWPCSDAIASR